jgi:hypothetical protein
MRDKAVEEVAEQLFAMAAQFENRLWAESFYRG